MIYMALRCRWKHGVEGNLGAEPVTTLRLPDARGTRQELMDGSGHP